MSVEFLQLNFCTLISLQESKELTSSTRWRYLSLSVYLFDIVYCHLILAYNPMKNAKLNILTELSPISKAVTMFENDERYKAVERARDREDLFESYIVELERKVTTGCFAILHILSRLRFLTKRFKM